MANVRQPRSGKNDDSLLRDMIVKRMDELNVSFYWMSINADGARVSIYRFLNGKTGINLRTLESMMRIVGLEVVDAKDFIFKGSAHAANS